MGIVIQEAPTSPSVSYQIRTREHPGWKRALDLCVVLVVTPLLAPFLLAIAIYIRIVSPGPVLFVQSRVGYGGKDFSMYKFRTMHVPQVSRDERHRDYLADRVGCGSPMHKPNYQDDLIPGGNLLRTLSIDEFPQLFNVFQGNMSLVGPRPDLQRLQDYEPWQLRRFEVLPGMTGLWQVSGKNRLTNDQMNELDIQYIESLSFSRDLRIIAKTFFVLLLERNE
jgi:lipopolysaccharide/colanic/teichoic acid biosynthesis glycosyltransferase